MLGACYTCLIHSDYTHIYTCKQQERCVLASTLCTRMTCFLHILTSRTYSYVHQYACLVPATFLIHPDLAHIYTCEQQERCVHASTLWTGATCFLHIPTSHTYTYVNVGMHAWCLLYISYTFRPYAHIHTCKQQERSVLQAPSEQGQPVSYTFRLLSTAWCLLYIS